MPTKNDIEEAKAYLRERLEAETSMRNNLEKSMLEAASRIVEISYKYKIPPSLFRFSRNRQLEKEVNEVIGWLKSKIEHTMLILAIATHEEDGKDITSHITKENHGKTFAQRNNIYCNRFKDELEGAIAAGLVLGLAKEKLKETISANLTHPYSNPVFREAEKKDTSAARLLSKGVSYGNGRTNSMFTALDRLTSYGVAQGWMKHWWNMGSEKGAKGFVIFRGSSYPCQTCDEAAMRIHDMSEPYPPLHLNCKCGMYFVY